jgi:hypothetical protein
MVCCVALSSSIICSRQSDRNKGTGREREKNTKLTNARTPASVCGRSSLYPRRRLWNLLQTETGERTFLEFNIETSSVFPEDIQRDKTYNIHLMHHDTTVGSPQKQGKSQNMIRKDNGSKDKTKPRQGSIRDKTRRTKTRPGKAGSRHDKNRCQDKTKEDRVRTRLGVTREEKESREYIPSRIFSPWSWSMVTLVQKWSVC